MNADERPALWVGHVALASHDLERSLAFYREMGLRQPNELQPGAGIIELEMRGGTHLVFVFDPNAKTEGRPAPFDLMPDDIDALHASLSARGVEVSPITRGGHDVFTFVDPDGYVVTVNSSHVVGAV